MKKIYAFLFTLFVVNGAMAQWLTQNTDSIQAHFTISQCDSLIQANEFNPDFCVMDVRTPAEYTPEHLEGAINRDYYSMGFDSLLDLLPRHKMYLIYCLSGGRSGSTFTKMVGMGFSNVINMLGGITAWKNSGFPVTSSFAPLHMAVSDTVVPDEPVNIGTTDTILLTVTNRANDTLWFTSITSLAGSEFSTDFDMSVWLEGPFDYTFSIFYTPFDTVTDSLICVIESNGGTVSFHISRTGQIPLSGMDDSNMSSSVLRLKAFPNPASAAITIETPIAGIITILNTSGQQLLQQEITEPTSTIDVSGLRSGVYVVKVVGETGVRVGKFIKQ
jgi:rhodanese-related sulfurtransferase